MKENHDGRETSWLKDLKALPTKSMVERCRACGVNAVDYRRYKVVCALIGHSADDDFKTIYGVFGDGRKLHGFGLDTEHKDALAAEMEWAKAFASICQLVEREDSGSVSERIHWVEQAVARQPSSQARSAVDELQAASRKLEAFDLHEGRRMTYGELIRESLREDAEATKPPTGLVQSVLEKAGHRRDLSGLSLPTQEQGSTELSL